MTFDPFNNRVAFGLLTDDEKEKLTEEGPWEYIDAYKNYGPILGNPVWRNDIIYRRTKPPVIMPTVDWSYFGKSVTTVAWDAYGNGWAFTEFPTLMEDCWWSICPITKLEYFYPSNAYTRGTCDWKDSLVIRPKEATE